MAIEIYESFAITIAPGVLNTDVYYARRSEITYLGAGDIGAGGYMVAIGGLVVIATAVHDKVIGCETQVAIGASVTIDKLLGFEPVLFSIDPTATVNNYIGHYFPNLAGVPNIGNVTNVRCYQSDFDGADHVVSGEYYGKYGHTLFLVGAKLAPAAHVGYRGSTYYPGYMCHDRSLATVVGGNVYVVPFHAANPWSPNRIGIDITVAATAGKTAVLGIYLAAGGYPTDVHAETATFPIDVTGYQEIVISATLPSGMYFLAIHAEETIQAAFCTCDGLTSVVGSTTTDITDTTVGNVPYQTALYTGSLPTPFSVTALAATNNAVPNIMLRVV